MFLIIFLGDIVCFDISAIMPQGEGTNDWSVSLSLLVGRRKWKGELFCHSAPLRLGSDQGSRGGGTVVVVGVVFSSCCSRDCFLIVIEPDRFRNKDSTELKFE